ncbi:uncharacterized protein LOC118273282 [Spodoptera frugiperda]|uniref:Uncharacterized protein LOC118273282 n=1 Tax=Spodoptera frugiperda TaxID=7108 RepID=A0A9R0DRJ8_SPOFR|nr:uncharacterized protein LOC118273282 [Spodoptera frugiperda]
MQLCDCYARVLETFGPGLPDQAVLLRVFRPRPFREFLINTQEFDIHPTLYPPWWTHDRTVAWFRDLPDDTLWNCYICAMVLLGLVWTVAHLHNIYIDIIDVIYNVSYALHIFAIGHKMTSEFESTDITFWIVIGFLLDIGTFAHYVQTNASFKLGAYYIRLHRPYKYLASLNDYNLKGSILGTTLKYCYIFMVMRITWAYIWLHVVTIKPSYYITQVNPNETTTIAPGNITARGNFIKLKDYDNPAGEFLSALYMISKMYIPIGPSSYPDNDIARIFCIMIMMSGCLVVTGAAVASLSLIISLYMRPEEAFRSRYRLIIKEMTDTRVPLALRNKVETFYKMYWHKQRAVSKTQLLPTYPPTLPATINLDIYFEATQKTRILRDLTYQILSELAKKMETIHFIPGDAIIKRGSKKCRIIYITYGDVEMLTAEDDTTAILRMTRGTVLTPCGGTAAEALTSSHLAVRAATFCTAHVLEAANMWRIVCKHSVSQDHAGPILASFTDHIEKVKRHYSMKEPVEAMHKSSILQFNRNLIALKSMKDSQGVPLLASPDIFLEIAGCYIMRNRPDTTLTDQSDEICLRPSFPCILQPHSSLLVAWNAFVAFLILVICIVHPYNLIFKKVVSQEFRFFDFAMTIVYVLDHIVYLSTGANVEEGVPITFAQTSSKQMRSHWFVLNVVATLPIFEFVGDGHFAGINKLLSVPKLFRELKSLEESCGYRSNVLRFLSYTLLLLIACYFIAAIQQGFMCFQAGYCLVTNFTHSPFWEESPLDDGTIAHRLIFGLYWAISMISFINHRQTWAATEWKHVIYTLFILEICIVLRIFMEAVYSATIMVTTAPREDYGARIETVKNFLVRNEVDPELRKRFITYLELCWYTDKAYTMTHKKRSNIFHDLPPHVFQDIVGKHRINYIHVIPFMKLVNKEDLKVVMASVKIFYTSPNEILINTGELTNEIYIIKRGICEVLDPITQKCIGQLTAKTHFGSLTCLLRLPAYYTIRAVTHVHVMCIPRKVLGKVLSTPQISQALKYLKTTPEFQSLQTPIPSFVTYVPPPPTANLMYFRLPRKHQLDTEFLAPFDRLGFLSILRYIFPRYTIRPDGNYLVRYEWFRFFCAFLSTQLFPAYTYLVLQWPYLYYVAWFLDLAAYYDIFQRMLIGYFNDIGILVYHPASTASYYMKGAFIVDLFGCLPLENLESPRREFVGDKFRVTPTKQFLMLNRILQLYRMPGAMKVLKEYIGRRDILMILHLIPIFSAMLNILTCFIVFYSVKIYYKEFDRGKSYEWLLQPFEDRGGSWLHLFKDKFRFNLTETPWNLHLATYFWVVYECSTTGYGTFNPSNHAIMRVLFIGLACSAMIITYYSVRIISVRANVNKSLAGFQQHMKDINTYMIREKLDPELHKEVRRYYEYNWEKMGGIDYRGVLKLCDQITLRTDAILHIYGPTFAKCPILVDADVSLLRILGRAVRSVYFLRDMKILELNDMATELYFVDYGGVEIRVPMDDTNAILRLPRGSVFGNLENVPCLRSPYNVVATSRLHLLMIKSAAFANITKDFPVVRELMEKSMVVEKNNRIEKKMYILGGEATIKMKRHLHSGPPPRTKTSVMKYIYFQEGAVLFFLVFICMGCIYLDLYNAGFEDNSTWLLITLYSLDVCFYLKIFTQHAFPFLVPSKSLKKIMLPIRRQYFRREFKYDLISVLPIELFTFAGGRFAILRLNRMLRIVTVYKCLCHRKESITVNLTLTTVMAVSIWFTLIVHTSTCIWYFMAVVEDQIEPGTSWMHLDDGTTHCDNHYICSLYFVLTTFTQNGVGDIMPKKHSEVVFVAILQILSTMVFMIYVGELSNIIQYQSYRSFSFYSKYLELQKFLKNNRVSQNLVTIVNKYTLHLWREKRGLQIPHFLKEAPLSLRLRIMSAAYLHHITRHHIFEECEPAFLRQMVGCLKLYTYNEGMYVVKESEITDAMYVIHTGKVRETSEEDTDVGARVYPAGSYFGVLQGLLRNTPYTHSYQTVTKSQVLTLKLDDWEYLLNHFPESKKSIHKHMSQLGDDNTDHSNWPGGPITEAAPDYVISEMQQDTSDMPQYPDGRRHFGRDSATDVREEAPPKDLTPRKRKESRYFAFPSDNKKPDTISVVEDGEEENRTLVSGPSGIQIQDTRPNLKSILGKIAGTAKKLMGRVSDPELTAAGDELLLEEDAEATEALLKHFDKAKKQEKSTFKRQRTRRPSLFFHAPEETTEKHLVTLDMESDVKLDQHKSDNLPVKPLTIRKSSDVLRLSHGKSKVDETASKIELTIDIEGALDENKARENKILSPSQGPAPSQGIKETSRIQATQNTPYTSQATTSKQATRDIITPTGQIPKDSPSARKLSVPTTLSYPEQKTDQKSTLPDLEKVIDSLVIQDKTKSIEPTTDTLPPTLPKAPLREAREEQIPGTSKPKDIILKSETSSTPPFVAPKVPSKSDESRLERSIKLSTPPAQDVTNIHKREENANIVSVIESTELISEALVDQDDTKKQPPSEAISTKLYTPQKLRTESNKDIQSRTDTKEIKLRYSAVSSASSIILRPVASTETEPKEANQVSRSFQPARSTSTMHTLATTATETSASRPYTPIELSPNINRDVQHSGQESQPNKDITNIPATASKPAKTDTLREYKADEDVASQSSSLSEEKALETVDLTKPSTVTVYEPAPTPASSTALGSTTNESSVATAERKAFKKKQFIYDPNPNYDEDDGAGEIIQDPTTTAPPQPTPTLTQEEATNTKSSRRSIRVRYDEHKDDDMEYGSDTDESEDEKPSKEDETRPVDSKQPKRDDKGATSTPKSGKPDKKSKK